MRKAIMMTAYSFFLLTVGYLTGTPSSETVQNVVTANRKLAFAALEYGYDCRNRDQTIEQCRADADRLMR